MALDSKTIQFPLIKGLNTKVDSKQIAFGEMSLLENAVFKTVEKFRKRNGFSATTTNVLTSPYSFTFPKLTSTVSNGVFCSSFKNERVINDGFSLYSYSESDAKWAYKGRMEMSRTSLQPIYQGSDPIPVGGGNSTLCTQYHPDCAVNTTTGLSLYAWEMYVGNPLIQSAYVGLRYGLYDTNTGAQLFIGDLGTTASRPRCIAIGSSLYLFYFNSSSNKLQAVSITSTGASAATDIVTNINATLPNYDIFVNNSLIYVGYNGTASTVKVASFNSALVNQASASKAEVASNGIGIFSDASNNIWVAYNDATNTKAFIMNSALAVTVLGATVIEAKANVLNVTGIHDGTQGIIFYDVPGNPRSVKLLTTTVTGTFTQPAVGSTVSVTTSAAMAAYVGQVVFLLAGGDYGFYYITQTSTTTTTLRNIGITNVAAGATFTTTAAISTTSGARSTSLIRMNTLTAGGSVGTAAYYTSSLGLSSRAFLYGGIAHVGCAYEHEVQPTNFLTSLYDVNGSATNTPRAHYVARIASNYGGGLPTKSTLSSVNTTSTANYLTAVLTRNISIEKTSSNNSYANWFNGVAASSVNLAPSQVGKQELGENLHVASGSLMMYDGTSVVEHGFHMFPDVSLVKDNGTGSPGRVGAGLYGYAVCYAWQDAQGQIHRSAPSLINTVSIAADNSTAQLSISYLAVTQKNDVYLEVYRTLANGSVFFRVDTAYYGVSAAYPFNNLINGGSLVFLDYTNDSEISGNQQLYTTGEVENIVSPSPTSLSLFKNRLLVVPADDKTTDWYSKQVIPGSPVELSDSFVQNTDQATGSIVGCAQLDDKWIIFKGKNVFYVVGSGPAASGANNDFSDPVLIATDVGLVDSASIVVMPLGVMFKSDKGVYLLDRAFQVQYIGAKVENYNSYTVVNATLLAKVNQVRFLLSSGEAIVFDYFVSEWTVFTNHAAVDAMISGTTYYHLKSNGVLMAETDGVYSDNGSFISMKLRTGWIQLAGLQGFQRIWKHMLLGDYISAHQLQVQFAYDFNSSIAQTVTISPTGLVPYEYGIQPARQKCTSVQLTIQDVYTNTIGESYSLSNIAFEVGVKKGLNKLPAAQSYG